MPTVSTDIAPTQIKIGVADKKRARTFYESAFGLAERAIRHTTEADFRGYQFGD